SLPPRSASQVRETGGCAGGSPWRIFSRFRCVGVSGSHRWRRVCLRRRACANLSSSIDSCLNPFNCFDDEKSVRLLGVESFLHPEDACSEYAPAGHGHVAAVANGELVSDRGLHLHTLEALIALEGFD